MTQLIALVLALVFAFMAAWVEHKGGDWQFLAFVSLLQLGLSISSGLP